MARKNNKKQVVKVRRSRNGKWITAHLTLRQLLALIKKLPEPEKTLDAVVARMRFYRNEDGSLGFSWWKNVNAGENNWVRTTSDFLVNWNKFKNAETEQDRHTIAATLGSAIGSAFQSAFEIQEQEPTIQVSDISSLLEKYLGENEDESETEDGLALPPD